MSDGSLNWIANFIWDTAIDLLCGLFEVTIDRKPAVVEYGPDSVKTGYEVSFTRYVYKPPLRTLEDIRADLPWHWRRKPKGCWARLLEM